MGARRFILLGNCGVLDKRIEDCGIIIPTKPSGMRHQLSLCPGKRSDRRQHPLYSRIYRGSSGIWVSLCAGRCVDDGCLLPGDPAKVAARRPYGRGMRGDGVRGHAGHVRFPGCGILSVFLCRGQSGSPQWDPRSLSGHARLSDKEKITLLAFELASRIG